MLEAPEWRIYYHLLNFFATVTSLLWMFIIIIRSPNEMYRFKWALFKLALSEELFSLCLGVFFFPDPLFPASAGAILGLAAHFGEWGGRIAFCATVFFGMTILTSINDCLFIRSLIIHEKRKVLDFLFKSWWMGVLTTLAINLSMGSILWTTMFMGFEDAENFIRNLKPDPFYVYVKQSVENNYTVIAMDKNSVRAKVFGGTVGFGLLCLYLANLLSALYLLRTLERKKKEMSTKTFKTHRSMIMMLLLQNMYPVFSMMLPVIVAGLGFVLPQLEGLVSSVGFKHWILTSLMGYPIISFISSVAFIKPYRQLFHVFNGKYGKSSRRASRMVLPASETKQCQ